MCRVLKPDGRGLFFEPFGLNPFVNILRKVNLIVSKRQYEAVLTPRDIDALKKTFGRVVFSDLSVIYKIPRCIDKHMSKLRKFSMAMRKADITLQRMFPFVKRYFSAAFIELYKASPDTKNETLISKDLKEEIKSASVLSK
jgi:hypothetical protein